MTPIVVLPDAVLSAFALASQGQPAQGQWFRLRAMYARDGARSEKFFPLFILCLVMAGHEYTLAGLAPQNPSPFRSKSQDPCKGRSCASATLRPCSPGWIGCLAPLSGPYVGERKFFPPFARYGWALQENPGAIYVRTRPLIDSRPGDGAHPPDRF